MADAAKSVPSPPLGGNPCPAQVKVGPESESWENPLSHSGEGRARVRTLGLPVEVAWSSASKTGVALHFPLVWQRMVVLWGQQPVLLAFK